MKKLYWVPRTKNILNTIPCFCFVQMYPTERLWAGSVWAGWAVRLSGPRPLPGVMGGGLWGLGWGWMVWCPCLMRRSLLFFIGVLLTCFLCEKVYLHESVSILDYLFLHINMWTSVQNRWRQLVSWAYKNISLCFLYTGYIVSVLAYLTWA